jgi:hypothetical protein
MTVQFSPRTALVMLFPGSASWKLHNMSSSPCNTNSYCALIHAEHGHSCPGQHVVEQPSDPTVQRTPLQINHAPKMAPITVQHIWTSISVRQIDGARFGTTQHWDHMWLPFPQQKHCALLTRSCPHRSARTGSRFRNTCQGTGNL